MNLPSEQPHEEPTAEATPPPTRDLDAEHAAVMATQLRILFILLVIMAGCFTLAWEGLQSALSTIH